MINAGHAFSEPTGFDVYNIADPSYFRCPQMT